MTAGVGPAREIHQVGDGAFEPDLVKRLLGSRSHALVFVRETLEHLGRARSVLVVADPAQTLHHRRDARVGARLCPLAPGGGAEAIDKLLQGVFGAR